MDMHNVTIVTMMLNIAGNPENIYLMYNQRRLLAI